MLWPIAALAMLVPPAGGAGWPTGAGAVEEVRTRFSRDHRAICDFGSRFAGQEGVKKTADFLEAELKKAGVDRLWRQPVDLVVPASESCTLRIDGEPRGEIYPVWPNGANLSATPAEGITAEAVYIGAGELDELPVDRLAGGIAVMEFNSQSRWQYAAMYGAVAIVFLRPDETSWGECNGKYSYVSVPLPRFYVHDPDLAQRLRDGRSLRLTVRSRVDWRRTTGHNVLGFIPGRDPKHADRVVVLHSRYDACCVVPDLAYGAEQAINPAVLVQLARHFAAHPPAYSVLLAFVCGDTFELTGSRRLMRTLTDTQKLLGEELAGDRRGLAELEDYRQALTSDDLAGAVTGWGNRHLRNKHVIWQTKMQIVRLLDEITRLRRMQTGDTSEPERMRIEQRLAELNERRVRLVKLQRRLHHDDLGEADVELLRELLPDVLARLDRMIADRAARLERRRVDLEVMEETGLGRGSEGDYSLGILFCSIELSSHGARFGPFAQSYLCDRSVQDYLGPYGKALREIAQRIDLSPETRKCYIGDTAEGLWHWQSDLPFPVVNGIDAAVSGGCLGMMFATTQDMRRWVDTPLDTIERVDFERLIPQVVMLGALLDEALHRPMDIVGSPSQRSYWKWEGMAARATPGESQLNLGVPDVVICAKSYNVKGNYGVRGIGVRDMTVVKTDGEGKYAVDDVIHDLVRRAPMRPEAYVFGADGRAVMAMDMFGPWDKPITGVDRKKDRQNLRGEMFECVQIGLFGLNDARYLEDLDKLVAVEAARGSEVRRWYWRVDAGLGSFCLPTDIDRWQLVFAKGDAKRRMVMLNASAAKPEGEGYPLDWRQTSPLAFTSASDFAILNEHRISRLEDTGVVDPYLREQHEQSQADVRRAVEARDAGDGAAAWGHAAAALTTQAQVYQKTRGSADDTIYAVLFLLVGLVPFSYFLERLLIGSTNVYRQIGGFALLFVIMTLLVATFHPAFRISMNPITILLAFLILFLSVLVVAIILGKFRTELERLRKGRGAATDTEEEPGGGGSATSAEDFKRFDVLHRAMLLGIANMRRRKIRTGLTLATLVLLSFVIMSFTNPQTHIHPLHYDVASGTGIQPDRSAVMIQRMSWNPLPAWTLDHLRTCYRDRAEVAGHWWITRNDLKTQYSKDFKLAGKGDGYSLLASVACIEPMEARVVGLDLLIGQEAMDRFVDSDDSVVISSKTAERAGVSAGDTVEMFGSSFTVAAVAPHRDMLTITGLNGQRYAPIDYLRYEQLHADRELIQEKIDEAEAAETAADVTSAAMAEKFRSLSPDQFAIIRASRAAEFDATLRAVIFGPRDPGDTMALADELASQIHRPVYANTDGRVVLCAAAELTSLTGLGNVAVPLIISALIILNTMMNCVYERRREIGILMSVGLAPAHVGALFVAEAAAYGTIGVVGGYIIGQGLGTVASTYGLIPGIHLNFSSSAVLYTQVAIMVVVLLSSLWPAYMATKIAAPGSESSWKLPPPDGDDLHVALPFTMHGRDAEPVLAYLHNWLAEHTETSLGRFCSGAIEVFADKRTGGRGFVAQIWLAPFDLGIMQTVELEIHPGSDPTIHEVGISLRREAGPNAAWVRSNRHFLTEVRKRFLLWRSLGPNQTAAYHEVARTLF